MSRLADWNVFKGVIAALAVLWLAACGDAPEADKVSQVVQERLASAFEPDTFELTSFRRQGSGPLAAASDGKARRIVYFNAELTLKRDLDFSSWETLNIAAFANLLGATEKGISGIEQDGNQSGDRIYVRGSSSFVRDGDAWTPIAFVQPDVGTPASEYASGPPSETKQLIEQIMALTERETADPERQSEIITHELERTARTITIELDRLSRALVVAGGAKGGEYVTVAQLLAQSLAKSGVGANAVITAGSTENLRLLRDGNADIALVQNDIADLAFTGSGDFERSGPQTDLRALASLFPEAVHIVVAQESPIAGIGDLAGKRVEIGKPNSGSRTNALSLLKAAGITLENLGAAQENGLEQGLVLLANGEVDAVIATINAPARVLQEAAARHKVRFLSVPSEIQDALTAENQNFVAIQLPAATYPGQSDPIRTVAVTALLVSWTGLAKDDVDAVLTALFDEIDFVRAGSAAGSSINRRTAKTGVTIPLHPAAAAFLETK